MMRLSYILTLILIIGLSRSVLGQETSENDLLQEMAQPDGQNSMQQPPPPEILDDSALGLPPPAGPPTESAPVGPPSMEIAPAEPPAPEPTFSSSTPVITGDISEVDANREERFARIYQKFDQSEIDDEEWSKIAGTRVSETYALQNGDTLWDISEKFFGNGFFWPKVWQLNDSITNPHLVEQGYTLRFSSGSATVAPQFAVEEDASQQMTDQEPEIESEIISQEGTESGVTQEVYIPPPSRRGDPFLSNIPPSFVDRRITEGSYDSSGFSLDVSQKRPPSLTRGPLSAVISDEPWQSAGKIIEMEGGTSVASNYQSVIVKLDLAAQAGDVFTVFKNMNRISDPIDGGKPGIEVETRGKIQIQGPVEGMPDTYRAIVLASFLPINMNDSVVAGDQINRIEFNLAGAKSPVSARIIDGEFDNRKVFGLHSIVFLNKGEADGLQVGNLLQVLKNARLRNSESVLKFDTSPIGILKVAHVGKHVATAVIVSEKDAIFPGDETGLGQASLPATPDEISEDDPNSGQ